MINLTATKPALKVVFDQCGTPTYALDLAHVIITIIEKPQVGVFHFSNEGVCSWYDFTQLAIMIAIFSLAIALNTLHLLPVQLILYWISVLLRKPFM